MLVSAGLDPSAVIGGKLKLIGGSGRVGKSGIMTCEACEFQDTFLSLFPDITIILNIDEDHLDYFKTLENIIASFRRFAEKTSRTLIVNGDDANSLKAVEGLEAAKKVITFGFGANCEYRPESIERLGPARTGFALMRRGVRLARLELNVPGRYNVLNAVAACAAAIELGMSPEGLKETLPGFTGAGRRFEILGEKNGVTVMDDYAHHPAELRAALEAAKGMGYKRVWAVFQPFTYSRTKLLLKEHAEALALADRVVMSEIMGGREENTYGIYTKDLAALVPGSVWFPKFPEIAEYVMRNAAPGDLVMTLGCGDIYKCAKMMLE
jgi:UDP-N-acetylmuramate--alanine ligase